jgi:hypothetical protein
MAPNRALENQFLLPATLRSEAVPASLEIKSNYQAMLEGQGEALGFSNELVKMVEDKRNVHKYSEKRRRDELKVIVCSCRFLKGTFRWCCRICCGTSGIFLSVFSP